MNPEQNSHIQPAAEYTPLDETATRVFHDSGGATHHAEQDGERLSQEAHTALGQPAPVAKTAQLHETSQPQSQKRSVLDVVTSILTLTWFKKNMRHKYGEDINRVREVRQEARDRHLQKTPVTQPPSPATPPSPSVEKSVTPPTPPSSQAPQHTPDAPSTHVTASPNLPPAPHPDSNQDNAGQRT